MSENRALFTQRGLEGEYTTWNFCWVRENGAVLGLSWSSVDNYGNVLTTQPTTHRIYRYDRAGNRTIHANMVSPKWMFPNTVVSHSCTGKYELIMDWANRSVVHVFRYGEDIAQIDTSAYSTAADAMAIPAISGNGRYIVLIGGDPFIMNATWVLLFEGV